MRRRLAVLLSSLLLAACASTTRPPSLVLTNGKVFTADESRPWAEAIAIDGDRIVRVGTTAEIRALAGPRTTVIDAGGRVVVPGINDAHVHTPWSNEGTSVRTARNASPDDVLKAIAEAAAREPRGTSLRLSIAPDQLDDPRLTRAALDAVAPEHPVSLGNLAGHARLLNSAALRAWNIADDAADPKGGRYGRTDGRLNGWVYEHALWTNDARAVASASDEALVGVMREFADEVIRYGITSVQSMPLVSNERAARLERQAATPLRWRWMEMQLARVETRPNGRPLKYVLDGTPIERGAALRAPWSDRAGWSGAMNYTADELRTIVETAARHDEQLLLHISGDAPLEQLFALMREVPADWPARRVRIEHGDFIGDFLDDAARLKPVLVLNPSHMTLPELFAQRLGARAKSYSAARSLLERGIPLALGSDGPLNPWLNMFFATMNPSNPSEALTREQVVVAYTRGSAFAERKEHEKGSLAPGKLADLAVLSQDVFTVAPPELPKTTSVLTLVGGKVAWRAEGF